MSDATRPQLYPYEQNAEPVQPPSGFGPPRFRIGDRVLVAFTTMAPAWLKPAEGKTGTVKLVVFCRSDGKTILYGVEYDTPISGENLHPATCPTSGRFESFELNRLEVACPAG